MKDKRLDQILIDLEYVTEDQIKHALQLQHERGGRIGTHLLRNGNITEPQLSHALSVQFDMPAFLPERHRVSPDLVKRLPLSLIEKYQVLPVNYDPSNGVLTLVVVDPEDQKAISEVRRVIRCADVALMVTPEATLAKLIEQYIPAQVRERDPHDMIELPELFDTSEEGPAEIDLDLVERPDDDEELERVLLVSDQAFLNNFLDPIFEREGLRLIAATDRQEIKQYLQEFNFDRVLVSHELEGDFQNWIRQGVIPNPGGQITEFSTVSSALLDNLVPYRRLYQSLIQSLKIVAEITATRGGFTPPVDLLRRDCRDLAAAIDLPPLAVDGLELAVLLIVPAREPVQETPHRSKDDASGQTVGDAGSESSAAEHAHGIAWDKTLEHAKALRFPWNIESALRAMRELQSEQINLEEFGSTEREIALAAQVLAVVWHHHYIMGQNQTEVEDYPLTTKTELRKKSGHLARSDIIESYLRLIEEGSEDLHAASYHQLFIVGEEHEVLDQFSTRLRHLGYHPVCIGNLAEARTMCERCTPSAVFVHDASFPEDILSCRSLFNLEDPLLLYAITMENDPSRVLNLFDAGFDDVFSLPHDFDIVAARLRKSIKDVPDTVVEPTKPGSFRASLAALSFTDLLQTLSQSQKSVAMKLIRSNGDQALLYLDRGQLVYAECGQLTGPNAVYAVIVWEEDGVLTVEPVSVFPKSNISLPLETILMEGCRILDESRMC